MKKETSKEKLETPDFRRETTTTIETRQEVVRIYLRHLHNIVIYIYIYMMKDDEIKALARWPEKKRIPAMGIPH